MAPITNTHRVFFLLLSFLLPFSFPFSDTTVQLLTPAELTATLTVATTPSETVAPQVRSFLGLKVY